MRRALHELCDDEGKPCDAQTLWAQFCEQTPAAVDRQGLARVTAAIVDAQTIATPVSSPDAQAPEALLRALLHLGAAFAELFDHIRSPHSP